MRLHALLLFCAFSLVSVSVAVAQDAPPATAPAPAGSVAGGAPGVTSTAPAPTAPAAPTVPAAAPAPAPAARREETEVAPATAPAGAAPVPPAKPSAAVGMLGKLSTLIFGQPAAASPAADLSALTTERDTLRSQLQALTTERDTLRAELTQITQGMQQLHAQIESARATQPQQVQAAAMNLLATHGGIAPSQLPKAQPVTAEPPAPKLEGRALSDDFWAKRIAAVKPSAN